MIYYMDSKVFAEEYLDHEYDEDILKADYLVVSARIRRRRENGWKNVSIQTNMLFPSTELLYNTSVEEFKVRYYEQLDEYRGFLAYIVNQVARHPERNVIFLCSHGEDKHVGFLYVIAEYIRENFAFPVLNYQLYIYEGKDSDLRYSKKKVKRLTEAAIEEAKLQNIHRLLQSGRRSQVMDEFKRMRRSELKKLLKKEGLYERHMTRKDMVEACEFNFY